MAAWAPWSMPAASSGEMQSCRVSRAPAIDGRLDDPAWVDAAPITAFSNFHPQPGRKPSQATELRIAHDERNIYLAHRCRDSRPEAIRSRLAQRDRAFDDDWVGVILDAAAEGRGAAELIVNPHGCQLDAWIPGDGSGDRFEVDYPFQSASRRDSAGWSAEMAIPFASLRGPGEESIEMIVFALRHISRTGERAAFPSLDPSDQQWLAHGARVRFAQLAPIRSIDVWPALVCGRRDERESASATPAGADRSGWRSSAAPVEFGLAARWALGGGLALDCTYNPDFSQVEADARQVRVNRRFPIFYPEKRPFFLRNRETFALAAEGDPLVAAFHSRSIVDPRFGIQLTGQPAREHTLGILVARDEIAEAGSSGVDGQEVVVARYRWSPAPGIVLGGHASGRAEADRRCRAAGVDGDLVASSRDRWAFHALFSRGDFIPGRARSNLSTGHADAVEFDHRGTAHTVRLSYREVSPAFDLPAGFLLRRDLREAQGETHRFFYPRLWRLNRLVASVIGMSTWDFSGQRTDLLLQGAMAAEGRGGWGMEISRTLARERFVGRDFDAGGWRIAGKAAVGQRWLVSASAAWSATPRYDASDPRQGASRTTAAAFTLRPHAAWDLGLEWTAQRFRLNDAATSLYDESLVRLRLRWQPHRCLHLRALLEWDGFAGEFVTDGLISFTYVPGTLIHIGWGNLYREQVRAAAHGATGSRLEELQRDLFVKIAYGLRL
ncbi:MAG: carbohydrate binding family 9 domain-containing protein [Candidatus Eisenbacteria bacterium]